MPHRDRSPDFNHPDAAMAALALDAAQHGEIELSERLARMAERLGRLKHKLEPGELQRLSRIRALERRMDEIELKFGVLLRLVEDDISRINETFGRRVESG
jgi:hypothetical protein